MLGCRNPLADRERTKVGPGLRTIWKGRRPSPASFRKDYTSVAQNTPCRPSQVDRIRPVAPSRIRIRNPHLDFRHVTLQHIRDHAGTDARPAEIPRDMQSLHTADYEPAVAGMTLMVTVATCTFVEPPA